jgi:hypothetical protein
MAEYKFPAGSEDHIHRIITVKGVQDNWLSKKSVEYTTNEYISGLHKILAEEFPGAECGHLVDVNNHIHYAVVFESPEDTLSFSLKYGQTYGDKA